jgi:class 3 adenylate cyclase
MWGYPFASPTGFMANDSVRLAQRFYAVLQEEARLLQSDVPICCGIGIALDNVVGFYPDSGTKEYDLYGRAVILATRYEEMRKKLLKEQHPG